MSCLPPPAYTYTCAALALTLFALGCDANFSRPDTQEGVELVLLPEAVRHTLETRFQGGSIERVEKRLRSGRELYLAFGAGAYRGERVLLDSQGKVMGLLHGEGRAPNNAYAFRPSSDVERLARSGAGCEARTEQGLGASRTN
jgi:hypothetical protein